MGAPEPMRICYSEEDDRDFIRWTTNLLRSFMQDGRIYAGRQFEQPHIMLASIWRPHLWPDIPVILVTNENWLTHSAHFSLERYAAVISTAAPPQPCTHIPFPYAAVHFDTRIENLYAARQAALAAPKSRFCCFVASNAERGELAAKRLQLACELESLGTVDRAGKVGNNTGYLAPRGIQFLNWISNYRYMVCPENSCAPGYITEKPLQAWFGGAIPIYDGGAKDLLNPEAFIDAAGDVIGQIRSLEADPQAYEAMRAAPLTRSPFTLADFEAQFQSRVVDVYGGSRRGVSTAGAC